MDSLWIRLVTTLGVAVHFLAAAEFQADPTINPRAFQSITMEQLKSQLMEVPGMRSVPSQGATSVNITLGIRHITLNEIQSTMAVSAWVRMEWLDPRVREVWLNNAAYKEVKRIHMNRQEIWFPSILLRNGLAGKGESLLDGSAALVRPDGQVTWQPHALLEVSCRLDLRQWPFERHECALRLGSWANDKDELRIASASYELQFPDQTGEFVVDRVREVIDEDVGEEVDENRRFDGVTYTISLHREPGTYRAVVYTPATVVVILCLATFLLPPRAGEKVVLGGVNAVLICLFLIYFAHSLPVLSNQTPLIVLFYSSSLYLVCMSLVVAVVILNISRQPHSAGLPWTVKKFLTGSCGRFLLLGSYIDQIMGIDLGPCSGLQEEAVLDEQMYSVGLSEAPAAPAESSTSQTEISSRSVRPQHDWLLLAAAVDRVLFIVYSLIFICIAGAFHV